MNGKKKRKGQASTVEDIHVQAKPLKVDMKDATVGECSKRKSTISAGDQKMVKKRHRKEITKLKEVEGHRSPAALYYVIEHLSTTQRKDVDDIGFRGLLELKVSKFLHTIIDWLLERYDTHTRLFMMCS
ncbi:uncharacterized protein LOC141611889 isoform X1 [Silene latifolia]|uniref:uncharacterized protein LOC141611889 isoform X1 n=1 Tax=Silene latifolia TaxID=37657 RepID=UPI003D773DD4